MRVETTRTYKKLIIEVGNLIDATGYSSDTIAAGIGMSTTSFVAKKKRNNFSVDEVEKIVRLLGEESVENYLLVKIMEAHEDEPTIPLAEFEIRMGWK